MKRFLWLCILCSISIIGYSEQLIVPTNDGKEIKLDMNEVILLGESLEICDIAWRDGLLQQAWDCCSRLEEHLTNPLFLSGIFLRKGLIAHELGRKQESDRYLLSFMKCIHKEEMKKIPEESRREFEEKIIEAGRSQAGKLKDHILSLYKEKREQTIN